MTAKVPRELYECDILFADVMENANGARLLPENPDNQPGRSSQLALQRLHSLYRRPEVLFKEFLENVHDERIVPQVRKSAEQRSKLHGEAMLVHVQ